MYSVKATHRPMTIHFQLRENARAGSAAAVTD